MFETVSPALRDLLVSSRSAEATRFVVEGSLAWRHECRWRRSTPHSGATGFEKAGNFHAGLRFRSQPANHRARAGSSLEAEEARDLGLSQQGILEAKICADLSRESCRGFTRAKA